MDIFLSIILNVPVTLFLIVIILSIFNKIYTILDR